MSRQNGPILLASTLLGALMGLAAGLLLLRRADERGREVAITGGEGLSIGLLAIGLLRQIAQLGDEE